MILLTGGTGFLGLKVLQALVKENYPVKVLTRGAEDWRDNPIPYLKSLGADTVLTDLLNPGKVSSALADCKIVVNVAGAMFENQESSFEQIHVEAVRTLVAAAEVWGVQRFIHVSCLGSSGFSESRYFLSKREGEALVKNGQFHWTIFRPSYLFGDKCKLVEMLLPLIERAPVVPLVAGGLNQVQPISVDDVAACIVQCIYKESTSGKTYDLAGPKVYSFAEIVKLIMQGLGKSKLTMNVSAKVALKAASVTGKILPKVPLTEDVIQMLIVDSVADTRAMKDVFQVEMASFEDSLPQILGLRS